ncbi:predicted protein [Botrytis cinerea T4]|uniref:Uncharacterized protein n=1 Tax=Botryotinia fuckeliana (strain T4) TaxID=999810 RepID=G2Y516_BOTF4|nr:predicted protein [Botrytis cinerea T4]
MPSFPWVSVCDWLNLPARASGGGKNSKPRKTTRSRQTKSARHERSTVTWRCGRGSGRESGSRIVRWK